MCLGVALIAGTELFVGLTVPVNQQSIVGVGNDDGGGGSRGLLKCILQCFGPFCLHPQRPTFTPFTTKFFRNLQYHPQKILI